MDCVGVNDVERPSVVTGLSHISRRPEITDNRKGFFRHLSGPSLHKDELKVIDKSLVLPETGTQWYRGLKVHVRITS